MASSATSSTPLPETEPQIEDIIIDIPKEIKDAKHGICCIYKVPPNLRKLNNGEAYTPYLISIGPFHHTKENSMHTQKQRYFHYFWERMTNKKALVKYKNFLKVKIEVIKNFYFEFDHTIKDDEFVDMIMLDSVFILELFLRKSKESEREKDYMFTTSWIYKGIQRDLLLLENQLPFYVLEQLYQKVCKDNNDLSFLELAFNYFEDYNPQRSKKDQNEEMIKYCKKSCRHFTDLVRCFYLPKEVYADDWSPSLHFKHINSEDKCVLKTASRLNEAGVSFEKVHHKKLLEIKFNKVQVLNWFLCLGCLPCFKFVKTKLQIPQFKVHQTTECVLRNLIALEQCHYSNQPFICNYVSLIDFLINTQEDVELLVDKEIIVHELGSHAELATMINGLCKNVVVTCNYYGKTSKNLNDHYYNYWKHYMGMLRSVYFRDPWRFSSTIVGVFIFLFAIAQFLRVTGIYHPRYY
ncbi:hypothetical protein MtrunA17_Chr8g0335071 [Medicago truncatula]|uniref:DUF247 domain protein n=1 Tax=Medicago truncatula TaxID=3880 RepID=A0A072TK14_MEDTR|nr:UPF0481 protein At3g47200 [Medicago truncatula]KEH17777.1 DUF247 domain protein [Medicago truncatula]RHN38610.1 hypothetical protein MtrunA17_Chr8g0335071 [Medicago truncatula]